ncbi:MAG TPA: hypothetical protein H9830_05385 [Candidatus Agrococcus pullicola]|uniref:Uncharacterized protein n=1 Tax=Candidatus Agrococcus pullicola TaxID=2838429 RepID=A0A9D1YU36_9MICO|nr:hypothetical protein [Candidatus Agrococcus pullicola]
MDVVPPGTRAAHSQERKPGFRAPALNATASTITLALIAAVVISSFLGRTRFEVIGYNVRLEQIAPVVLAGWMIVYPRLRTSFFSTLRHPVVVLFSIFLAWNVVSTLLFSPDYTWSASIIAWLAIDLLLLMSIMALRTGATLAFTLGASTVVPWALLGVAVFILANVTNGAFSFGVAFDWLYEIYVARVTAIEANIFASILMVWGIFSITRRRMSWWWILLQCVAIPLGLLASQTRTAVVSMVGGLLVFAVLALIMTEGGWRSKLTRVAPAMALVVSLVGSYGAVALIETAATPRTAQTPTAASETLSTRGDRGAPPYEPGSQERIEPQSAVTAVIAGATSSAAPTTVGSTASSTALGAADPDPTPTPPPAQYVPDPTDPNRQNKIGDLRFEGGTIGFRIAVAQVAAEDMAGVNLWFGNGTNTFGLRHDQPNTSTPTTGHIIMLPVQVLYDAGIVGLALLLGLFVAVFAWTPRDRKPIAAGVLASFLVSSTLTSFFWFAITWIMIAVLLRPADGDESRIVTVVRSVIASRKAGRS